MTRTMRSFYSAISGMVVALGLTASQISFADDAKSVIDQAYQRTNTAKSVDDYSEIIQLCADAEQLTLTKEQSEYVKSLQAWSYNRRGEVLTEQATQAYDGGQAEQARQFDGKALADFEASLQFDPKRWKTWHNRAVSRAIAGKYQEAIDDFGKVIELKKDYAHAWFNRGEILYDLGKVKEAVADYTEAIKLDDKDAGAYSSRGHSYFRLGQSKEALADYTIAIKLAPQNADMLANRGDALQSLGRYQEAAEDFRAAIDLNKESPSPRVLQSAAWLMATAPDDPADGSNVRHVKYAVESAETAVKLLESAGQQPDARYLDTLAAAYANAGRFEEAVAKITAAIQQAPTEQRAVLQKRLQLYQQKQPYRQAAGEKTAAATKKKAR
jgi:tetratricopeptide (TPR) repeat protein